MCCQFKVYVSLLVSHHVQQAPRLAHFVSRSHVQDFSPLKCFAKEMKFYGFSKTSFREISNSLWMMFINTEWKSASKLTSKCVWIINSHLELVYYQPVSSVRSQRKAKLVIMKHKPTFLDLQNGESIVHDAANAIQWPNKSVELSNEDCLAVV